MERISGEFREEIFQASLREARSVCAWGPGAEGAGLFSRCPSGAMFCGGAIRIREP